MTTKVIVSDEISARIHDILAGEHFDLLGREQPQLYILSPWISNVQITGKIPKMGPFAPQIGYDFESIDLAHALVATKLIFGTEICLVTLPPKDNKAGYSNPEYVKRLLDFLDENNCKVYLNEQLHSKMLLTRQIAIVGSINLTKSALYDREEIAISIDDLENLRILKDYARDVIKESEPYGYSVFKLKREKVTRGWLLEWLVWKKYNYEIDGWVLELRRNKGLRIEDVLSNLDSFYFEHISELLAEVETPKISDIKGYSGPYTSSDEILRFFEKFMARKSFPEIRCRLKRFEFDFDKYLKVWENRYQKRTRRQIK